MKWKIVVMITLILLLGCSQKKNSTDTLVSHNSLLSQKLLKELRFSEGDSLLKKALINNDADLIKCFKHLLNLSPEWLALVDKNHKINLKWKPLDLVTLSIEGVRTSKKDIQIRKSLISPLKAIIKAANDEGIYLSVISAYRDTAYQQRLWDRSILSDGINFTKQYLAEPGTSQHHLGSTIDFNMADTSFDNSPAALWLARNAKNFGFSLSYPKGYEKQTGYNPESWHYRYFPVPVIKVIENYFSGLQFAFLEFWNRNEKVLRNLIKNDEDTELK